MFQGQQQAGYQTSTTQQRGNQSQQTQQQAMQQQQSPQPQQQQQQMQSQPSYSKQSPPTSLPAPVSARIPRYCFAEDKYWFVIEAMHEDGHQWELSRYYEDFYD